MKDKIGNYLEKTFEGIMGAGSLAASSFILYGTYGAFRESIERFFDGYLESGLSIACFGLVSGGMAVLGGIGAYRCAKDVFGKTSQNI